MVYTYAVDRQNDQPKLSAIMASNYLLLFCIKLEGTYWSSRWSQKKLKIENIDPHSWVQDSGCNHHLFPQLFDDYVCILLITSVPSFILIIIKSFVQSTAWHWNYRDSMRMLKNSRLLDKRTFYWISDQTGRKTLLVAIIDELGEFIGFRACPSTALFVDRADQSESWLSITRHWVQVVIVLCWSTMTLLAVVVGLLCAVGDGGMLAAATPCQVVTIFGLKTSDCERLALTSVPVDIDADVKVMRLADNRIATLRDNAFSVYSTLQELYLARNRIVVVSQNAFHGLRNLQTVDLSGNRLTTVRADFLRHLTSVRSLSFASNPIVVIELTALQPLTRLERVSFAGGKLARLDGHLFAGMTRLTEIDLSGNQLTSMPADMRHQLPTALRVFRFYGNPWMCDCRLRWLRLWTATRPAVNWDFARNTPTCAAPPLLRSVSWRHLDVDQFACPSSVLLNSSTSVQVIISFRIYIIVESKMTKTMYNADIVAFVVRNLSTCAF